MNFYWVYSLPTWAFALLTIAVTVGVGLAGLFATRKWVRGIHGGEHSHNEVVGFYPGAVCVFYGIALGLLSVATWQNFTDVETRVGEEAAAVGVLYRDVSAFLSIAVTWFFHMKSQGMHFWMTVMLSALLGLLIFLLGALDNPFRGEISVSPQPFELVYQRRMASGK